MAIEGVMKIFLMIAVIIVGMSFLLKAFGIDIIGWLQDKLGGFGVPPTGVSLHIKTDPDDSEIWEFHLVTTNGLHLSENRGGDWKFYFGIDKNRITPDYSKKLLKDKCVLLLTDENNIETAGKIADFPIIEELIRYVGGGLTYLAGGSLIIGSIPEGGIGIPVGIGLLGSGTYLITHNFPGDNPDNGAVFYVKPGTSIQEDCINLNKCIENGIYPVDSGRIRGGLCTSGFNKVKDDTKCSECIFPRKKDEGNFASCLGASNYIDCTGTRSGYCDRDQLDPEENKVIKKPFDEYTKVKGDCKKGGGQCNLIDLSSKDDESISGLTIKHGVLCDGNGIWRTCSKNNVDMSYPDSKIDATCRDKGGFFVWDVENIAPEVDVSFTVGLGEIPVSPENIDLNVNDVLTIKVTATDSDSNEIKEIKLEGPSEGCEYIPSKLVKDCSGSISSCLQAWKMICTRPVETTITITATDNVGKPTKNPFDVNFQTIHPTEIDCAYRDENCIFDKNLVAVGESIEVGGILLQTDSVPPTPIENGILTLWVDHDNDPFTSASFVGKTNPTEGSAGKHGLGHMTWSPTERDIGTKKYILYFEPNVGLAAAVSNEVELTVVRGAPILHIKIETDGSEVKKVFAFHLTNDNRHGQLTGTEVDFRFCNIYAVKSRTGSDRDSIWYINPGGRVVNSPDEGISNIYNGLDAYIDSVDGVGGGITSDSRPDELGALSYTYTIEDDCESGECDLLTEYPSGGDYRYWPKAGLLCGDNKKWNVCDESFLGKQITVTEAFQTYRCELKDSPGPVIYYTWTEVPSPV